MADSQPVQSEKEERSSLAVEVGARLRERREEVGIPLREAALAAEISPSHLSDMENGRSHASLPVLIRLCRILRLPMARLLPRLGGHRVFRSSVSRSSKTARLSHPDLELAITHVNLAEAAEHRITVKADEDVFAFVLSGDCDVAIDGSTYSLRTHDAVDVEQASSVLFRANGRCSLLVCMGRRR